MASATLEINYLAFNSILKGGIMSNLVIVWVKDENGNLVAKWVEK